MRRGKTIVDCLVYVFTSLTKIPLLHDNILSLQQYRPPTPPLLSQSRSHSALKPPSRAAIIKSPEHRSDVYLSSTLYPSRNQSTNYLGIYAHSRAGISHTTFQTDTITPSLNPSLGWAQRLEFSHKTMGDDVTIPDRASSTTAARCWKFSFRKWIKRLRTSRFPKNISNTPKYQ
jgi:hypothetical protein